MSKDTRTIEVNGFFGPKQLSQDAFVKEWDEHVAQLTRLSWHPEDVAYFDEVRAKVTTIARKEFNRLYEGAKQRPAGKGGL